ncbi:MAG: FxsA family protein [Solirubrobacteraceae bacterium]
MIFLLALLWLAAEVFVAIKVAEAIGVGLMLLALLASGVAGVWVVRAQSAGALRRLSSAVAEQRMPAREVLDAALGLLAGVLLIVPGFIGDALGLLLLLAPIRALARKVVAHTGRGYLLARFTRLGPGRWAYRDGGQADDVESTAIEVQPPKLSA